MNINKLSYRKTFLLGFGFFCISLVWPLYNNFVPIFLSKYVSSTFLIGIIMTFDNIAAVTLQPLLGGLSDRTNTKFGKRMPYLLIGIPLSALFFTMIPFEFSLLSLIAFAMLFNIAMSIYRAPTVALMPDLTPAEHRSKANGIINFMGGVGTAIALSAGSLIYDVDRRLPFIGTAVIMIIALAILYKTIKEPKKAVSQEKEEHHGIVAAFLEVLRDKDKSALLLLFAIFFWFVGYQGIEALFSLYVVKFLGFSESAAGFTLFFFSAAFIAFSIPSGYLASAIGRRRTIKLGLTGLMLVFVGVVFVKSLLILRILMAVGGLFWACININSYPMVVQMTTDDKIGAYTGLYYFFASMAAIVGPPLFGAFIDVVGFGVMFVVALCFLLMALLSMGGVKKGEAVKNIA